MDAPAAFELAEDLGALSATLRGRRVVLAASMTGPEGGALAVHPEVDYVFYDLGERVLGVARDRLPAVLAEIQADHLAIREVKLPGQTAPVSAAALAQPARILAYASGAELVGLHGRHPASGALLPVVAEALNTSGPLR